MAVQQSCGEGGRRSTGAYVLFTPQGYPGSCGEIFEEPFMTASIRFGRIAGIPVGASWSALLIALLFAWSLGGDLLPAQVPGLVPVAYWLGGGGGGGGGGGRRGGAGGGRGRGRR